MTVEQHGASRRMVHDPRLVRSEFCGILRDSAPNPRRTTMPSAVPADAEARLPEAGRIDPRGHRFGAGVSAVVLVGSFVLNAPILVAAALLSIGVSAAFGLRWSIYGAIWRRIVRGLSLPPTPPEHGYPPRLAPTL